MYVSYLPSPDPIPTSVPTPLTPMSPNLPALFRAQAPQAGEVAKFLIEDGAPVDYQGLVVELAPFFGGHIIGEAKHV